MTESKLPQIDERRDHVCEHGTAMDVHCCHCHSGFIFDKDHECPELPEEQPPEITSTPRLRKQAQAISVLLSDAGCPAMPIVEGVKWLIANRNKWLDAFNRSKQFQQECPPFKHLLEQEVVAAHQGLDRLGAPKTKQVLRRGGEGTQVITMSVEERFREIKPHQ